MPDLIFKNISERCFNKPLLIEEGKARVIASYLEGRMGMHGQMPTAQMVEDDEFTGGGMILEERPVISGRIEDVVVIPVIGTLVNRQSGMDAVSGMTSHRSIRNEIVAAANDRTVKAILLDIDSGGGEVEGNFDLGRLIRQVNDEVKPVVAIANGDAFSGAFSLGVSAGQFFVTETGGVGSVGVIIQHVDFSGHNEAQGIKVTNIKFGEDKDMFSSDFPLSAEAKAVLQNEVDRTGELFINHVAEMRGISTQSVIDTQAALIFGEEGVNINFVDGISSFDDLLENMISSEFPIGPIETKRMSSMFLKDKKANADAPTGEEAETPAAPAAGEDATAQEEAPAADQEKEAESADTPDAAASNQSPEPTDPTERAAEISALCSAAGNSEMAPSFIRSSMTVAMVKDKIDMNTQVSQACVLAGKPDRAASFISNGTSLKEVQSTLISEAASEQEGNEISSQESPEKMQGDLEQASKKNVILEDANRRQEEANSKGAK